MKTSFLILIVMIVAASLSASNLRFIVSVGGIEDRDILKEGVTPSELTQLTIRSNDEKFPVSKFEIIHARDNSALSPAFLQEGNSIDLQRFRAKAKTGDQIVIKVTRVSGLKASHLTAENSIIRIPIR